VTQLGQMLAQALQIVVYPLQRGVGGMNGHGGLQGKTARRQRNQ